MTVADKFAVLIKSFLHKQLFVLRHVVRVYSEAILSMFNAEQMQHKKANMKLWKKL